MAALCATIITKHDPAMEIRGLKVLPAHVWQSQVRQSAGYRTNNGDAMSGKIPSRAGRDGARDRDQRGPGILGDTHAMAKTPATITADKATVGQMHLRQAAVNLNDLSHGLVRLDLQAQHSAKHCNADLKPHPGEKPDQHSLRRSRPGSRA